MKIEQVAELTDELVEAVGRLTAQLSQNAAQPGWEGLDEVVNSKSTSLFIARDESGAIIGMAILAMYRISTGIRTYIEDVVVDEKARGQGVGEALCRHIIQEARELGVKTIDLTSRPSREAANRLYQKMGFEKRDTNVYRLNLS
jgi:ribosomal protein S18 acetylase RimI-like enzyme